MNVLGMRNLQCLRTTLFTRDQGVHRAGLCKYMFNSHATCSIKDGGVYKYVKLGTCNPTIMYTNM